MNFRSLSLNTSATGETTSGFRTGELPAGWESVPPADEPLIERAWRDHLQRGRRIVVPNPSRSWNLARLPRTPSRFHQVEAELSLKLLAAFRRCIPAGERLLMIEWQHQWYFFDPHAVERVWPRLFDGEAYHFVTADFRLGVITHWTRKGRLQLFGQELTAAFEVDPPQSLLRLCGPGSVA